MLPAFNEHGYLPAGVHPATLEEIEQRFGRLSELRRAQMESLRWMIDLARRSGIAQIILNGSFVTDTIAPNDVDCVLRIGSSYPLDREAADQLMNGLPFLGISVLDQRGFDELALGIFSSDRWGVPKGVIEVISWT